MAGRDDEEVKTRLGTARAAFKNLEKVLRDRKMKMEFRIKILKCYVWSIASSDCEIHGGDMDNIEKH